MRALKCLVAIALAMFSTTASSSSPERFRADAESIAPLINENYAYLDRLPQQKFLLTTKLQTEARQVRDKDTLLKFVERILLTLGDHHAISGSSFDDSWALVPSYSDLWVERINGQFLVTDVRMQSPASGRISASDSITHIDGEPTEDAVSMFWRDLGVDRYTESQASFAARILVAGRRDRPRKLVINQHGGHPIKLTLPSLYKNLPDSAPIRIVGDDQQYNIRFNDSLGDDATIVAFDAALARAKPNTKIILDLTDTPSGGNTVVARAIMGWFVSAPRSYQIHRSPAEERRTGIARQWIEQVLPRPGKFHAGPVVVRVGRWTGSMGEGMAVGLDSIGARVEGDRMAGLLGAVEDLKLRNSGLIVKLPTEKLFAVNGTPREEFVPQPIGNNAFREK